MIRAAALAVAAFLLAGFASAKDAAVGTASLTLPPPPDYCEMDVSKTSDARMVNAIEGMLANTGNRLLAVSADCKQLADWRTGKRQLIDNMAQYQTLVAWENGPLPGAPDEVIKATCDQMRTQGDKLVADMTPDIKARAEQVLKTVQVNEMRFLGVVGEEPQACYAALLQKFKTEIGTEKTQVTVFATVIIRGKLVYHYLFAPYVDGNTASTLLAEQQENVRRLRAANP